MQNPNDAVPFANLVREVAKQPRKFLGAKSLIQLQSFMSGYEHGWCEVDSTCGVSSFTADKILRERFLIKVGQNSTHNAFSLASVLASDDEGAFDLFVEECQTSLPRGCAPGIKQKPGACSLLRTLLVLRDRPEMFLGSRSLARVRAFVDGYVHFIQTTGQPDGIDLDLTEFAIWIQHRFKLNFQPQWDRAVAFFRSFDDTQSVDFFYEMLDEYRADSTRKS